MSNGVGRIESLNCFALVTQSGQMGALTDLARAPGVGSRWVPNTVMSGGSPVSGSIVAVMTVAGM